MVLKSQLFQGDAALEAAAVSDSAHILRGAVGPHVQKIQSALMIVDDPVIVASELQHYSYGPSTAAAVRAYKTKRHIINRSYQTRPDDIVGRMTVAALDDELLEREKSDKEYLRALKALDEFTDYAQKRSLTLHSLESGIGWKPLAEKLQNALVLWHPATRKQNG